MSKPVVIDLCCGLGGWSNGFLAEGWDAIGFDIERHRYPARELAASGPVKSDCPSWSNSDRSMGFNVENAKRLNSAPLTGGWVEYPGELLLHDVLKLNGYDLAGANPSALVASPPCQRYSYMAQPWKRAKREGRWQQWERDSPFGDRLVGLNALFNACFRIQRELSDALGRKAPMVLENVKGAQPWVGRAQANFGSYYLWGDIANVGGRIVRPDRIAFGMPAVKALKSLKNGTGGSWFGECDGKPSARNDPRDMRKNEDGEFVPVGALKNGGTGSWFGIGSPGQKETMGNPVNGSGVKGPGGDWFKDGRPGQDACVGALVGTRTDEGLKQGGNWWHDPDSITCRHSSRSSARKAASAMIAEIPFELASHIARVFKP